ncbi:molybdate ABC transporter substrate-binding protein [Nocardioides ferulae]|uniref:molybdate ABC transporter substrate-binding protein n=1 Tax=Nocardioides ferulae TaxID=2340821 RepID=UPI00197EA4F0|nr:molybdate ABC transporter substrate-binding protein [Nocardioides ferulae]
MTHTGRRSIVSLALALTLPLTAAGCGGDAERGTLTVLAAASLTEPFTELAERFEEQHPDVEVRLAFDSSATLAQQVVEGAPADVLATADGATMLTAAEALDADPLAFATNHLVLAVPRGPGPVEGVADLADPDVSWVACVPTAPCGRVAATLLEQGLIAGEPVSLEVDVKAVLARVVDGEADAGLVYASDVVTAGDSVRALPLPGAADERTVPSVLALPGAPGSAQDFVDLLLSREGQDVLRAAGFGPI